MRRTGRANRVRLGSAVLAVALMGAAVAGCSGPDPTPSPTAPPTSAAPAATYRGTPEEQLMSAVQAGDVAGAKAVLAAGQSPDYWLDDATPLGRAIVAGNTAMVQALLDSGATVDNDEWSHSTVAAQYGDGAMMQLILDNGGTATGPDDYPGWILASAAYAGNVDAIGVLIAAGADPNALVPDERGDFPTLIYAVNGGSLEAVQALVEAGADPYLEGSDGTSARDAAKGFGREEIADYLGTVVP